MSGLVKSIVELEAEADALIEGARSEAKKLEGSVREEVASYQDRINRELDARISAYQDEARVRHAREMADAKRQLEEALVALSSISEQATRAQVNRILEHYKNL